MNKQAGRDLICKGCGGLYYTTTDEYNIRIPIYSAMFKMKPEFIEAGWEPFPPDPAGLLGYGNLYCPNCETPYANEFGFAKVKGLSERKYGLSEKQFEEYKQRLIEKRTVILEKTRKEPEKTHVYVCVFCGETREDKAAIIDHMVGCSLTHKEVINESRLDA